MTQDTDLAKTNFFDTRDALCTAMQIPTIKLVFRNVTSYGGKAFVRKDFAETYIVIATDELTSCDARAKFVLVHELCHVKHWMEFIDSGGTRLNGRWDAHGRTFKEMETKYLAYFDIVPVYRGNYPRQLLDSGGNVLWDRRRIKELIYK